MIKNFDTVILDNEGKPIADEKGKKIGIGKLLSSAIHNTTDNKDLTGEQKYQRAKLADKIVEGKKVEIKAEDIAILKEVSGKFFLAPWMVKNIWDFLDA